MAHYRIVQRPSYSSPWQAFFEIQERVLFWWEYRGLHYSVEEAEHYIAKMKESQPIKTKVIKEYN